MVEFNSVTQPEVGCQCKQKQHHTLVTAQ